MKKTEGGDYNGVYKQMIYGYLLKKQIRIPKWSSLRDNDFYVKKINDKARSILLEKYLLRYFLQFCLEYQELSQSKLFI